MKPQYRTSRTSVSYISFSKSRWSYRDCGRFLQKHPSSIFVLRANVVSSTNYHTRLEMNFVHAVLCIQFCITACQAYTVLSNSFLRNVSSSFEQGDTISTHLLPRLLQPRMIGSPGHTDVQTYIIEYFDTNLPRWSMQWQNSTITEADESKKISNMIFTREPPWTKPGQANFLTFAAHYDSNMTSTSAADSAIPCALLLCMYDIISAKRSC